MTAEGRRAAGPDVPGPPDLPAIPVSAGALIFDRENRLLILKPTYKSGWTIPGGVMEADGETPWQACQREVREETGIEVRRGQLACMDFRRPRPGNPGGIRFLFRCDGVDDRDLAAMVIQPEEVSAHQILALTDALPLLRRPIRRRVRAACARPRAGLPRRRPAGTRSGQAATPTLLNTDLVSLGTVVFDHVLEPVDGGQTPVVKKVAGHGGTAPLMLLFAPERHRDIA